MGNYSIEVSEQVGVREVVLGKTTVTGELTYSLSPNVSEFRPDGESPFACRSVGPKKTKALKANADRMMNKKINAGSDMIKSSFRLGCSRFRPNRQNS